MKPTELPQGSAPLLLRVEEAARKLGLGKSLVYELLARGDLASVKIGTARRIPAVALEAFVERLIEEQGPEADR